MYVALQVLTVMLAATSMSLSLAHALELSGKLRLSKEQYLAVQTIYYPGFTIGGFAEVAVIIAALVLLLMTPSDAPEFWLLTGALVAFVTVQAIFWAMTQPVNKYWLRETKLGASANRFFETGAGDTLLDWTDARDQWERSHVIRAVVAAVGMLLLTVAVAI